MLYQIAALVLEILAGLLTLACLLRLYMQHQRIPLSASAGNSIGPFIFALSDWLVLPLRRVLPALGRWDLASLVAALLVQLVQFALLWALAGMEVAPWTVLVLALFGVLRMAMTGLSSLVIVYAVLSWTAAHSPLVEILDRLVMPPLAPIRKIVPLVGGVDLSALVLLVLIQIASILLGAAQSAVLQI